MQPAIAIRSLRMAAVVLRLDGGQDGALEPKGLGDAGFGCGLGHGFLDLGKRLEVQMLGAPRGAQRPSIDRTVEALLASFARSLAGVHLAGELGTGGSHIPVVADINHGWRSSWSQAVHRTPGA